MKDSKNLLLVLLSVGLTSTWVYHLYDKSNYSHHSLEVLVKDSMATQEAIRDSIQQLYSQTAFELDTTKSSRNALHGQLDSSRQKIYNLRVQIADLLRNSPTKADLKLAREKIREYQERIDEIKAQNNDLETERTRLGGVLNQLNDEMNGLQTNMKKVAEENKTLTETLNQAAAFIASSVNLSAVTTKNGKEIEATAARKTEKFVFSFDLQNNIAKSSFYDLYVVITQPDNKVLQNDVWGASYFTSKTEGTKAYTTKIHFEYSTGERKKILYAIEPENIATGTYKMQVYQDGQLLGETSKTLN
jgi:predicted RNase H-like nuclease (RuvC/YqgF family)